MILSTLDPFIASRSVLRHPFYLKWSAGELTMDDMRVYAKEYFHLVSRIPGIVAAVAGRIDDPSLKSQVEQNAAEETEHVELWKRFARSVGVSDQELSDYEPSALARAAVSKLEERAAAGVEEGIVAMYALERELPAIAETKKRGLEEFYGLTSEDAHIYFDEHLKEEQHLDVWRSFDLRGDDLLDAAGVSLDAQHQVLDAVCQVAGIEYHCAFAV